MRLFLMTRALSTVMLAGQRRSAVQDTPTNINGVEAVCTGVGSAKDDPRWAAYPVKIVLATTDGANLANAHVSLAKNGKEVAGLDCDAPWILFKPLPGSYTATATLIGGSGGSVSSQELQHHGRRRAEGNHAHLQPPVQPAGAGRIEGFSGDRPPNASGRRDSLEFGADLKRRAATSQSKKKAGGLLTGLSRIPVRPVLDGLQVRSLGATRVRHDVERDLLAFVQRTHTSSFNSSGVDEHVLAAAFRRDKAKALGGVEELHGSDSQCTWSC